MNALVILFSLVVASIAQALLPAWEWFGLAKAPILLGTVVYYAFTRSRNQMLVVAVLAGVLQDALGLIPLGYSSACFSLVGLLVHRFRDSVFVFRVVTHFVVGAVVSGMVTGLLALLLWNNGLIELPPTWVIQKLVGAMMLGALFVPIVFRLIEKLDLTLGVLEEAA